MSPFGAYRQKRRKSQAGQIARSSTGRKSPLRIPSTHSSSRVAKALRSRLSFPKDMPAAFVRFEIVNCKLHWLET